MELIVVLAIMTIMVGAATATVSMLDSSYAQDAERGIKDYIALGRAKSMSVAAKKWYVAISEEDETYYAYLYKVVEETVEEGGEIVVNTKEFLIEKKKLGAKVSIFYGKDDTKQLLGSTNELRLYFNAATGKIENVTVAGSDVGMDGGIGYITIQRNDYVINLKVFFNTGKCERE